MEEFKWIPDYEHLYKVSNYGKVKSYYNKGKLLKPMYSKELGYYLITLWKNKIPKSHYIHRCVLLAFVGPSNLTCNHKDGIRTNNHLNNLEWITHIENIQHGRRAKLTPEKIKQIKAIKGLSSRKIGSLFNIDHSTVLDIINGKAWKNI